MRNDEPVILLLLLFCTLAIKSSLHSHEHWAWLQCQELPTMYKEPQRQKSCDTSLISLNLSCFCAASYMYGAINSSFPSNLISCSSNKTNSDPDTWETLPVCASTSMHSRPEIIHFPSPSGISIGGSHGGDRGVHGLMVFKKAPRIVTSVPLIVSLQLCYRSWRRFKEACTAWWSSRKRHLQACLQSVRCSVQENAKHHRLCAIVSGCVLHFKLTEGSTKPYDC